MILCKNCENEFEGKYCPNCGQKASVKRFSTKILFSHLIDKLLPIDRGMLFTAKNVLTRPGPMLREYLDGKRANYTKPFQFLLIIVAIMLLFFSRDSFEEGMRMGMGDAAKAQSAESAEFQRKMAAFVTENMTLILVGMLPFLALVGRWFYRKHDVNYAEHFIMNCYFMSGTNLISIPFFALANMYNYSTYKSYAILGFLLLYVGYYAFAHITFFREKNKVWNGVKAALVYMIAYVIYIVTGALFGGIGFLIYFKLFN